MVVVLNSLFLVIMPIVAMPMLMNNSTRREDSLPNYEEQYGTNEYCCNYSRIRSLDGVRAWQNKYYCISKKNSKGQAEKEIYYYFKELSDENFLH